jgi:probable phosphoglycerate mutase
VGRRLVVEADGGSRGNPGPAGYGAVVRDADTGEVLAEAAAGIGVASNNVAEYRGLIAGLAAAADLDPDVVDVRMDSKLVVEQMSGRWQVKHPAMRELRKEAQLVADRLRRVSYRHIPRAQNSYADRLANEAMDAAARGESWSRSVSAPDADEPPVPANRLSGWMSAAVPPTTTVLLRHGQTALSVERRFSGIGADPVLTDVGAAQAKAAAERLARRHAEEPFAAVYTSPLARARQTAEASAGAIGLDVVPVEGLRESDFGDWEGHTLGEVRAHWPEQLDAWLADTTVAPPNGESVAQTRVRVRSALAGIAADHPEGTVLVVSHVTPIKLLLGEALGLRDQKQLQVALFRLHLDLASISSVDWHADGVAVVRAMNDTGHLAT